MKNIEQFIEEQFARKYDGTDIFLVEVLQAGDRKYRVVVDSDSGLTIDQCAEISRYLEFYLDSEDWIPDNYELEVSSPGLEQPLKLFRQYKKNVGREVEVTLLDGKVNRGRLIFVSKDQLILESREPGPGSRHREKPGKQVEIPFIQIKSTKVLVTF